MKQSLLYTFILLLTLGFTSCGDDDDNDNSLKLYTQLPDGSYREISSMISFVRNNDMIRIKGGGEVYDIQVLDEKIIQYTRHNNNYFFITGLQTGETKVVVTDEHKNRAILSVTVREGKVNLKVTESFIEVVAKEETEDNKATIEAIKDEVKNTLYPEGTKYVLGYQNNTEGSLTIYLPDKPESQAIKGTFEHYYVSEVAFFKFKYNNTETLYRFGDYDPISGSTAEDPHHHNNPHMIVDYTKFYNDKYNNVELIRVFAVQEIEIL